MSEQQKIENEAMLLSQGDRARLAGTERQPPSLPKRLCIGCALTSASSDASSDAWLLAEEVVMRTTLNLDDALIDKACRLTGVKEKSILVREGLNALIERESARRLARLGGSEPEIEPVPRRQSGVV